MSKKHGSLAEKSKTLGPKGARVRVAKVDGDQRSSINLRIEGRTRELIDAAASTLGKTRTEFMVETARKAAIDVLLDERLFALDDTRYDEFVSMLDSPSEPAPRLDALVRRTPAWKS
ncbi:DUF1778 domain-containing protein [Ciceribacter sp. L1K23]|uniref:type II toxin-antitoxin system TacA family antitoxin n=1 Tax=Ciceribacter sp. L1K23 TaxID=2820276 RepID=UPI001B82801F|nr:DUF1778 domain-containing protein [Ciceribacter sp. L1K23]